MAPKLPPKKDVCVALLEKASVFVHLDPRIDLVVVPPWFKNQPQLVLQVGLNMAVPIPDLNVDDECVSCTLSFNRSPFFCWVPWTAVFALVGEDGRGMVWPDDIPPEVAAQAQKTMAKQQQISPSSRRGHLRAVGADPEPDEEAVSDEAPEKSAIGVAPPDDEEDGGSDDAPLVAGAEKEPSPAVSGEEDAMAEEEPQPSKRKLPPYLRVVK